MEDTTQNTKTRSNQKPYLFFIGIIGGLVTIGMFLMVLDAYKVISIDNALNATFGKLFIGEKIQVISEIPGLSITITDKEKLDTYLKEYKFFENNRVHLFSTGKNVTVNKVTFILTDKPQRYDQTKMPGGKVLTSVGQTYDANKKTMNIYHHISREYYAPRPNDSLSRVVSGSIVAYLFRLTSLETFIKAENDEKMRKIGTEAIKDGLIVTIEKTE